MTRLPGPRSSHRRPVAAKPRDARGLAGWLFVLPALAFYAVFVLRPITLTFQYSLYEWNGIGASTWVGPANYGKVFTDPDLYDSLINAFKLIVFFSVIPVVLGLVIAATIRRIAESRLALVARTVLFLPQVIPLVAAGIAWSWLLASTGVINQLIELIGLGGVTRAWLGDFATALPAVGMIGAWVLLGLCTLLLLAGMSKIDPVLYEAARLDGAGAWREFVSITVPSLRQEIAVCVTVTVIAALASFDIIYIATQGGPGNTTMVPSLQIFYLAFAEREVGTASALAVVLMVLVAEGVNHELERPHVIVHDSRYYLFFSTQRHSFHPPGSAPTGLYGFPAPRLTGPYEPLNGSGLVLQNPSHEPDQAYAWLVLPNLQVISFANYRSHPGGDPRHAGAAQARAGFGGTVAPVLELTLDGLTTSAGPITTDLPAAARS